MAPLESGCRVQHQSRCGAGNMTPRSLIWPWGETRERSATSNHKFGRDADSKAATAALLLRLPFNAVVGCVFTNLWLLFRFLSLKEMHKKILSLYLFSWRWRLTCCVSVTAVRVLLLACDHTIRPWIKGHALSTSQFAIYSPYPLRLMTWTMQVEIIQITFPWKSLSPQPPSQVWGVILHVCAAVVLFAMWRCVSKRDGTAVKVQVESAFYSFDTFSLTGVLI